MTTWVATDMTESKKRDTSSLPSRIRSHRASVLVSACLAAACGFSCGSAQDGCADSKRNSSEAPGDQEAILQGLESAVLGKDVAAFERALEQVVEQREKPNSHLMDALTERFRNEFWTGVGWPGRFAPSAEALARLGGRGVRPLLRGMERMYATSLELGQSWAGPQKREQDSLWSLCGRDAEEVLLNVLQDEFEPVHIRLGAARALGTLNWDLCDRTVSVLLTWAATLDDASPPYLSNACFGALVDSGVHSLRMRLAVLRAHATDENRSIRRSALHTFDPDYERVVLKPGDLWPLLEDADIQVRALAATYLHESAVEDPRLRHAIESAVRDPNPATRRLAAGLLHTRTPWEPEWARCLLERLAEDEDEYTRWRARGSEGILIQDSKEDR